jgi:hypothetical protein
LLGLTLKASDLTTITINNHSDASYGVHPDGRSQFASATSLGKGSFSQKQKLTTKSAGIPQLSPLSNLFTLDRIIQVITNGAKFAKRMKHLDIKIFFLKDYIENCQLMVHHTSRI